LLKFTDILGKSRDKNRDKLHEFVRIRRNVNKKQDFFCCFFVKKMFKFGEKNLVNA